MYLKDILNCNPLEMSTSLAKNTVFVVSISICYIALTKLTMAVYSRIKLLKKKTCCQRVDRDMRFRNLQKYEFATQVKHFEYIND